MEAGDVPWSELRQRLESQASALSHLRLEHQDSLVSLKNELVAHVRQQLEAHEAQLLHALLPSSRTSSVSTDAVRQKQGLQERAADDLHGLEQGLRVELLDQRRSVERALRAEAGELVARLENAVREELGGHSDYHAVLASAQDARDSVVLQRLSHVEHDCHVLVSEREATDRRLCEFLEQLTVTFFKDCHANAGSVLELKHALAIESAEREDLADAAEDATTRLEHRLEELAAVIHSPRRTVPLAAQSSLDLSDEKVAPATSSRTSMPAIAAAVDDGPAPPPAW